MAQIIKSPRITSIRYFPMMAAGAGGKERIKTKTKPKRERFYYERNY